MNPTVSKNDPSFHDARQLPVSGVTIADQVGHLVAGISEQGGFCAT